MILLRSSPDQFSVGFGGLMARLMSDQLRMPLKKSGGMCRSLELADQGVWRFLKPSLFTHLAYMTILPGLSDN
jgi:hypothetical protein